DGPTVYAMCALDALGIPPMTRRSGRISSADPTSGQQTPVEVRAGVWRFQPTPTMVLAGSVTIGDACESVVACCPYINFHASPHDADAYRQAHPAMAAELFDQAQAVEAARRIFGGLLDPRSSQDPAQPSPRRHPHGRPAARRG